MVLSADSERNISFVNPKNLCAIRQHHVSLKHTCHERYPTEPLENNLHHRATCFRKLSRQLAKCLGGDDGESSVYRRARN